MGVGWGSGSNFLRVHVPLSFGCSDILSLVADTKVVMKMIGVSHCGSRFVWGLLIPFIPVFCVTFKFT